MRIVYKKEINEEFSSDIEYILEIDFEKWLVKWIVYPHTPKGMCGKEADQHWLGSQFNNGSQTRSAFFNQPNAEIHEVTKAIVWALLDPNADHSANRKVILNASKNVLPKISREPGLMSLNYQCKLKYELLFTVVEYNQIGLLQLKLLMNELESDQSESELEN